MSEPFDVIDRATRALREPVATDPAAKRRLVEALRAAPPPRRTAAQRVWRWLASPRPIMVSPLAGFAVAAALVLAVVLRPGGDSTDSPVSPSAAGQELIPSSPPDPEMPARLASDAPASRATPVQFVFHAPGASSVALVGDFNDWDATATPLRAGRNPGEWIVEVPLTAGRHVYSFIVDGEQWHHDPFAARAPESAPEAPSSVVLVGGRSL